MTPKQEEWYRDTLDKFADGSSWDGLKSLTWCAACLGIDPERVVEDAREVGKGCRAADIRRGIATAQRNGAGRRKAQTHYVKPLPTAPCKVRDYVCASRGVEHGEFLDASPVPVSNLMPHEFCAAWFRALWNPEDLLFVTTKGPGWGRLGDTIRPAAEWADLAERGGDLGGDLVMPNPVTGQSVVRIDGAGREYDSLICEDCLTPCRRYLIMEFDDLPEADQLAFWWSFLMRSPSAPRLVSLVRSGGKSIHALLDTGARTPKERARWVGMFRALFACDPEQKTIEGGDGRPKTVYPFRLDTNALGAITKTRIAGAMRLGTDKVQSLLYFNPPRTCPA